MSATAPFFSIVIPVFNRASSIGPTLRSVRDQDFADYECLIVDDGSDDGAELERAVRALGDPRFRYLRRENGGGGAARNTGIDAARGRFIAFLDSDDRFLPDKLSRAAGTITGDPRLVHYTPCLVERGMGRRKWIRPSRAIAAEERVATYLFIHNQIIQTSTIVLDAGLARTVRFDDALRKGQDLDFCLRLEAAGARFAMLPEPKSVWRDTSEAGRTSRTKGYAQPERWLEQHAHLMTPAEIAGYRATSLAYYWGWHRPLPALAAFWQGWRGGVPARTILRQTARTFLPRGFYRRCVDTFVALFGR